MIKHNKTSLPKKKKKMQLFDYINYIILGLCGLIAAYPLYFVLIGSFTEGNTYMSGGVWLLPKNVTLANYIAIFSDKTLWYAFRNTILKTIIGTVTSLLFTSIVAYALSRKNLKGRKIFRALNIFTMFFGGGLIPFYILIRYVVHLYDSFLVYVLPSIYSVYNMIIISSFFANISNDLHESAYLDGANEFQIFWRIYMPLSKPILATVALWTSVSHWNSYFSTMIYTEAGDNLITLQYYLYGVINKASSLDSADPSILEEVTSKTVSYAAIIIATLPILFVYPFMQRYFTTGNQLGATKG